MPQPRGAAARSNHPQLLGSSPWRRGLAYRPLLLRSAPRRRSAGGGALSSSTRTRASSCSPRARTRGMASSPAHGGVDGGALARDGGVDGEALDRDVRQLCADLGVDILDIAGEAGGGERAGSTCQRSQASDEAGASSIAPAFRREVAPSPRRASAPTARLPSPSGGAAREPGATCDEHGHRLRCASWLRGAASARGTHRRGER